MAWDDPDRPPLYTFEEDDLRVSPVDPMPTPPRTVRDLYRHYIAYLWDPSFANPDGWSPGTIAVLFILVAACIIAGILRPINGS